MVFGERVEGRWTSRRQVRGWRAEAEPLRLGASREGRQAVPTGRESAGEALGELVGNRRISNKKPQNVEGEKSRLWQVMVGWW
jgi:hypothetical protein